MIASEKGGLPPTNEALYDDKRIKKAFPFADLLRETIADGVPRPVTPAYSDISLAIQQTLHPPQDIEPQKTIDDLKEQHRHGLQRRDLLMAAQAPATPAPVPKTGGRKRLTERARGGAAARVHAVRAGGARDAGGDRLSDRLRDLPLDCSATTCASRTTGSSWGCPTTARCCPRPRGGLDLSNTMIIMVFSVAIELVLGMAIALVMHRAIWGRGPVRASILIPYGIVTVVAAFAWRYAFDPTTGFVAGLGPISETWAPLTERAGSFFVIIMHRGLEDHAVHGAAAARRAWRSSPTSCTRRRRSTARAPCSASSASRCR